MKKQNFCPICGTTKARYIKGKCEQCYKKKHKLVEIPDKIKIEQCKDCGKIKVLGKFKELDEKQMQELIEKKIKTRELEQPTVHAKIKEKDGTLIAETTVKGVIDSTPMLFQKNVELHVTPTQCDSCMKLKSSYHEAIIQIRTKDKKKLKKAVSTAKESIWSQHKKDSLSAITSQTEKKNGLDLTIGSKKAAQNALRCLQKEFNAETKTSSKLLGRDKKGNIKRRFTFLARI